MLDVRDLRKLRGGIVRQTGHLYANLLSLSDKTKPQDETLKLITATNITTVWLDGMARRIIDLLDKEVEEFDMSKGESK